METMLTKQALRERGWTPALMRRFLPDPDETRPNPRFRSAAPMLMWSVERIAEIERSDDFQLARAEAATRVMRARKAAATKRSQTEALLDELEINVTVLEPDELVRRACDHYNWRTRDSGSDMACPTAEQAFLERICVNYIRHVLTTYDHDLDRFNRRVGVRDAKWMVAHAVYNEITFQYPHLAAECHRQLLRKVALSSTDESG